MAPLKTMKRQSQIHPVAKATLTPRHSFVGASQSPFPLHRPGTGGGGHLGPQHLDLCDPFRA